VANCLFSSSYNAGIFVCYSESKNILVYSSLGISKFKYASTLFIQFTNNYLSVYSIYSIYKSSYKLFASTLSCAL